MSRGRERQRVRARESGDDRNSSNSWEELELRKAAVVNDDVRLYCKVFVEGASDREELDGFVRSWATGWRCTVTAGDFEISVIESDDFDADLGVEFPGGFVYFRHQLEVDFVEGVELEHAVQSVARLLEGLWAQGWAAIAMCDYEDRLPNAGGYSSRAVPWPAA